MSKWKRKCSQILSYDFIRQYKDRVNWEKICRVTINQDPVTPYAFLREFADKIRWDILTKVPREEKFFREFGSYISPDQWANLIGNKELFNDELLLKFVNIYYNWKVIIAFRELSEEFMDKYANYLDWRGISLHQKMSDDFIEKHIDRINPLSLVQWKKDMTEIHLRSLIFSRDIERNHEWSDGSKQKIESIDFIREFQDKIDFDSYILHHKTFPKGFLEEFKNKLHTDLLEGCCRMSEEFIERYAEEWNWDNIATCQKLSEPFIRRNLGRWQKFDFLFHAQRVSEDLIEEVLQTYPDRVNAYYNETWLPICAYQKLSEEFCERHAEDMRWYEILTRQNVSPEFMKKWMHKLDKLEMISFERWLQEKTGKLNVKDLLEN